MAVQRIVSWNVNGIRALQRKGAFEYLHREQPDVFCIQETKAHPEQLDEALVSPAGYHVTYHACSIKKGYSGVATFSKVQPESSTVGFGIERFDAEGRVVQSDFDDFTLFNVYFPNGKRDDGRLQYKLDFYDALFAHCQALRKKGRKIIICGDYNTAHRAIDLARPKQNEQISGFLPEERAKIDEIIAMGYVDVFREFTPDPEHYTWWSMQQRARERNVGWRIDYHFVSQDLMPHVVGAAIQPEVLGSDHCPITLDISI